MHLDQHCRAVQGRNKRRIKKGFFVALNINNKKCFGQAVAKIRKRRRIAKSFQRKSRSNIVFTGEGQGALALYRIHLKRHDVQVRPPEHEPDRIISFCRSDIYHALEAARPQLLENGVKFNLIGSQESGNRDILIEIARAKIKPFARPGLHPALAFIAAIRFDKTEPGMQNRMDNGFQPPRNMRAVELA